MDLISRRAAIDAVGSMLRRKFGVGGDLAEITLACLPSAQSETHDKRTETHDKRTETHSCDNQYCIQNGGDICDRVHCPIGQKQTFYDDITDEQAIEHLQSTGWMQNHDREMYENGLREQLADDSGSYDSLLPSAQPEIIYCKDCKHWDELLAMCKKSRRFIFGVKDFCSKAERREE